MPVKVTIGISIALLATPLSAHSVETAKGNWADIPLLARHHTVRLSNDAMATIDSLAASGKCSAIGDGKRIGWTGVAWPKQYLSGKTQMETLFAREKAQQVQPKYKEPA